jgi:hypothetical protein
MSPYGGMKLVAAIRLLLRTGSGRSPRQATPNWIEIEDGAEGMRAPDAADLLGWSPRVVREADPKQLRLDLVEPVEGREAEARPGFTPWW